VTEVGTISPVQVLEVVGPSSYDIKGELRDFGNELFRLLNDYADPDKDMVIAGRHVPADQKYTAWATMLFNATVTQMEQKQETLLGVWSALFQLEKSLGGAS